MFLCNPNRKTNEIALFFIFIQKPLIKLILYHNCRPALRYVAVLTAAIHSCFNSSTGHLSTKLRTAGLHFFETDTVWKVSKYGVISGPYFPAFGLNTERYLTPYLDTFHAVIAICLLAYTKTLIYKQLYQAPALEVGYIFEVFKAYNYLTVT